MKALSSSEQLAERSNQMHGEDFRLLGALSVQEDRMRIFGCAESNPALRDGQNIDRFSGSIEFSSMGSLSSLGGAAHERTQDWQKPLQPQNVKFGPPR